MLNLARLSLSAPSQYYSNIPTCSVIMPACAHMCASNPIYARLRSSSTSVLCQRLPALRVPLRLPLLSPPLYLACGLCHGCHGAPEQNRVGTFGGQTGSRHAWYGTLIRINNLNFRFPTPAFLSGVEILMSAKSSLFPTPTPTPSFPQLPKESSSDFLSNPLWILFRFFILFSVIHPKYSAFGQDVEECAQLSHLLPTLAQSSPNPR